MNSIFKYAVIFKDERIEIAGFGNYSIETLVSVILEGNAGTSYPYLTDCLPQKSACIVFVSVYNTNH
jgi:hypothetical protein